MIVDWQAGKDFGMSAEEKLTHAEEAPLYNKQKMRSYMPCSLMGPVTLWESSGGGRLLYGALHDKLQKLLKEVS